MNVIEMNNLTRDYGNGRGVFDLTFSVERGEVFGFLGPNGAGKTTTIRHLMGFIRAKQGSCRISGADCWNERDIIQQKLGYIPGEISMFDDMSGAEYLNFMKNYRKINCDNRLKELLERFDFNPKVKIKKMSKGMKQKLAITAAFMGNPDILILDEPTSGLDPLMQKRFVELIEEEKRCGKTILMSSHIFEEVEKTCDRVGIIRNGKLVTLESIDVLRERHMRVYDVRFSDESTAAAFAKDFGGEQHGLEVKVQARHSLESIFMDYYGGDSDA